MFDRIEQCLCDLPIKSEQTIYPSYFHTTEISWVYVYFKVNNSLKCKLKSVDKSAWPCEWVNLLGRTGGVQDSAMQLVKTLVTRLFKFGEQPSNFPLSNIQIFKLVKFVQLNKFLSYTGLFVESKNIGGDIIVLICYINSKE